MNQRRRMVDVQQKPSEPPSEPRPVTDGIERDANGAPVLFRVGSLVSTLERMLEHRQDVLQRGVGSAGTLGFYTKEERALRAAIAALLHHRATVERMPELVTVLGELHRASDRNASPMALGAARARAESLLAEFGPLV
jgi:hypothetical protein